MKNIIICLVVFGVVQAQNPEPQGRVIFITGSCSSGKSSMAKIIAQKLNAQSFAFDEYVMPIVLKKMVQKTVGKFIAFFITNLVVRNFFTFVGFLSEKRKYAFQKNFYEELQGGLAFKPTAKMYQAVRTVALQGQDVVVEAPLYLGDNIDCLSNLSELNGLSVTYVLAYCPLPTLVQRIKQRNASADNKTHRELDWALGNFIHYFDVSTEAHEGALDCLTGHSVHELVAEYAHAEYKKKRLYLLPQTQEAILQKFKTDELYYIYPRRDYDLIVDTQVYNAAQAAACVLDFMGRHKVYVAPSKKSLQI